MPRKAYIADVAAVAAQDIPSIASFVKGSEDGDLNICFALNSGVPIEIALMAMGMLSSPFVSPVNLHFLSFDSLAA